MAKTTMLLGTVLVLLGSYFASAFADTYVRGYYKNNGTYVAPHYRSSPDNSYNNNWSVRPNVNPHTGQRGTRSPRYGRGAAAPQPLYGRDHYRNRSPYGRAR